MTDTLFRQEVIAAKRGSWLGTISLAQPLPLWVLTGFATLAALAIVMFLVFGSYTRRSPVVGQLVPTQGLATVLAPATGVVARLDVIEGEDVVAGQTIAVISVPRATVGAGDAIAAVGQRLQQRADGLRDTHIAQQQLLAAQSSGLAGQLANARHELAQLQDEITTRQQQAQLAEDALQRMRQLLADRYVSEVQVQQQQAAHLQAVADVQVLQRQASAQRRNITQLQQAQQELPGQRLASRAGFQRDMALLEQEQVETEARGALAIHAPVDGLVAAQLAKPGQAVQVGQPLLTVLPQNSELEAELLAPSRAIGFIERGDTVLLRYQAYPYQKFGHQQGVVTRVSRSALNQGELQALLGSVMQGEPLYRVNVRLARQSVLAYGNNEPLRPGMALEADVLGERRRLIEWLFEPLHSLKGKVGSG